MNNTTYEFFIKRAWKCARFKNGANTDKWESLMTKKWEFENAIGEANKTKAQSAYINKFSEVKEYVNKAFVNLIDRINNINIDETLLNALLDLKIDAAKAPTPEELYQVIRKSYDILNDNDL